MWSFFISFLTIATTQTSAAPGWHIAGTLRADQVDKRSTKNVGVAIQSWWLRGYLIIGTFNLLIDIVIVLLNLSIDIVIVLLNLLIDIVAKGPAYGEE